jgi:predicted HTH transcriptional regulator
LFENFSGGFRIKFTPPEKKAEEKALQAGGESGALNGTLNGTLTGALSSQIIQLIKEHPELQRKTIIDRLGVPARTTDRHLAKLISGAKIERRGSKKTVGYWLCEKS